MNPRRGRDQPIHGLKGAAAGGARGDQTTPSIRDRSVDQHNAILESPRQISL